MPKFNVVVPHGMRQQQATERLQSLLTHIKEKWGEQVSSFEQKWDGNKLNFSLTTYGFNITGNLLVEDKQARIDGDLPFAAMLFKGKIESEIKSELEKALASRPAKPGDANGATA